MTWGSSVIIVTRLRANVEGKKSYISCTSSDISFLHSIRTGPETSSYSMGAGGFSPGVKWLRVKLTT